MRLAGAQTDDDNGATARLARAAWAACFWVTAHKSKGGSGSCCWHAGEFESLAARARKLLLSHSPRAVAFLSAAGRASRAKTTAAALFFCWGRGERTRQLCCCAEGGRASIFQLRAAAAKLQGCADAGAQREVAVQSRRAAGCLKSPPKGFKQGSSHCPQRRRCVADGGVCGTLFWVAQGAP